MAAKNTKSIRRKTLAGEYRKYRSLKREMAPFIRRRRIVEGYSTAGRWCDSSCLSCTPLYKERH